MLIQDALGMAGSAAGVAQHAGIALVAAGPFGIAILGANPALELAVIVTDIVFDRGPERLHPIDDRLERRIIKQHLILGMVDDIIELIIEQPRVDRVQDAAHADRAVPADEVPAVVHRQRCDPFTLPHAKLAQSLGHFERVAANLAPIGPRFAAIGPMGDNFPGTIFARGMINNVGDPKVPILHCSKHSRQLPRF